MATINFLFRSTVKKSGFLTLRLQHREYVDPANKALGHRDFMVDSITQKRVVKEDWEKIKKSAKLSGEWKVQKAELDADIISLEKIILPEFAKIKFPKDAITDNDAFKKFVKYLRAWLSEKVQSHYSPASQKINIIVPQDLVAFIGFYIEDRQLNTIMAQKFRVLQMRLSKFEKHRGCKITFNAINLQFATELSTFYRNTQEYNLNTIRRDFGYISALCSYAARKNINVTQDVVDFKIGKVIKTGMFTDHNDDVISTNTKTYYPYFTLKEIEVFEKLEGLSESLENVRDWFLVGCYTGQRISDFLNFDKSKIIESKGRKFLKFSQQKTKNRMLLPVSDKLQTVLDKRGGDFPRKIADQKFNDYIKKVAKEAGFTEKILGGKNIVVEGKGKRKVYGEYERWELISSHCCRRSFATNYYKIIPTYDLMYLTGHKTESEFLKYLNEEPEERAHYIAETYGNIL